MPTRTFSDPFKRSATSLPLLLGFTLVLIFFASSAYISYYSIQTLREITTRVAITHAVRAALEDVFSLLKDAETGQRGFVLTGDEKYLEPYAVALSRIEQQIANIKQLTAGDTEQQLRMQTIEAQLPLKLQELAETIDTRRRVGFEAARAIIMTDRGKNAMDELRQAMEAMRQDELQRLREGFAERNDAFRNAIQSVLASGLLGIVLAAVVAWLLRRADMIRYKQNWLQSGQALLAEKLLGEQQLADIGEKALNFLCDYLGANAGALFIEDKGVFRRFATYAVPSGATIAETFEAGDGLLGQAVKDKHPFIVKDVPPGYLSIGSSLGQKDPSHLLIAPTIIEGNVNAVMELGFFRPVRPEHLELLKLSAESLGASVHSARARMRIEALLEETQRQAEELQAQSEELRVSNEELEEQSQTLRHAQAELEQQQSELEQTNIQLETQKDELIQAKLGLESQARVVEQASRYKSAFLANMSHELRTPLNSSLILSQLLAENRSGNLTEEQIKYIRTIQSSGNDLLTLINDVLDLSKIEAGRMDLRPQYITIAHLIDTLRSQFSPMASNRGLALHFNVTAGAPEGIETDTQRLEQILRNLLSNALKFTEKGEVNLQISGVAPNKICFAVRDTGIGIAPDQQQLVFEPFSQADGTPSRKYGGTGLGLSISRELVHLLGGEIRLQSQVGKGSTFTVILPETLGDQHKNEVIQPASVSSSPVVSAAPVQEQPNAWPEQTVAATAAEAKQLQRKSAAIVTDDRQHLNPSQLIILVIEDDANFASILANFAHEKNFQCLVTASAHEALELARTHLPSAVILDIGLPDSSGLFVLDRLKDDPRTRHIPVHVISGSDYAEKAMAMGAAGYMLKPVPYDKLADAFKDLENLLTHRLRRVLVVEDDEVQLNALCSLLSSRDVQAIGAGNAASCLEQLQHGTFDCMVLDLSLPDASGFSLLEEISQDDSHSFPPVIIYTGRDLGTDEEQKLRRYSKSIIVKGAKSPERLLDEVALFLHQVVSELPAEQQRMIEKARSREMALEGRRVLLVEDDVRNIFALTSLLEPLGLKIDIARNGREALETLATKQTPSAPIDLVLMDIMMPEMDGLTAMREIRKKQEWQKLPIIALTAKAMPNDQQECLAAGANDYLAKPLDVEKLLSLLRVWMPR